MKVTTTSDSAPDSAPDSAMVRANAARAVYHVLKNNRTIDWVALEHPNWLVLPLSKALVFGTIRHAFSIRAKVDAQISKPLRSKDADIWALMLVGAYQLEYSDVPTHAAINETVEAVYELRKPWARGLVNAVLRKLTRIEIEPKGPEQSFDHPDWLIETLRTDYPKNWQSILQANNTRAPMVLRVNQHKISRKSYSQTIDQAGIEYSTGLGEDSLILTRPMPTATLPDWDSGLVAVQDLGAQFASQILQPDLDAYRAGDIRILDACAAPGGKLAHLIEGLPKQNDPTPTNQHLHAIDISEPRIQQTQQILQRLGHTVSIEKADASVLDWWDSKPFTHILVDAPCSGTGTIRRHPDIKVLLQPDSVPEQAKLQLKILHNLWHTLAPGGNLLYCTCSMLQAENDEVIHRFLEQNQEQQKNNASVLSINLPTGQATKFGWQLLPTDPNTDGFYYALLQKSSPREQVQEPATSQVNQIAVDNK